ncbi:2-oxoacid:acceptor oxidoreductase family protein [Rhodovulum kholense]|uniref:Indolepyruvate ferredoxin oxidoreductase beta subunit n=1 Tax=Rhodovulum kholense TaxID=453584 RepID=A0A8E2VJQ8_9RHOB|nr:2-oxoacid:acceptor oxidoreductase family protein [Rhodovulum kholense]PTW48367.1 indolepyruvate ferredoxin oxidoreductase beta subunit [Rhodovulum kholense]
MDKRNRTTNVLIVGVGGQGVIMVSKVLAQLCQEAGHDVKQSEVHGMAKRGGGVFSHVRFGAKVWSPTIPEGEVDILVALEWAEGLRWIRHLKPETGTFIADCQKIVPPFACRSRKRGAEPAYAPQTPEEIIDQVHAGYVMDATGLAANLGNARAANTVLLGALSTALDFPEEAWAQVIAATVPPKSVQINARAFAEGRAWALGGTKRIDVTASGLQKSRAEVHHPQVETVVEITADWCKGCDICVKSCPERCLRLNDQLKAELALPDLCTGCQLCSWLCPDMAISVTNTPVQEAAS